MIITRTPVRVSLCGGGSDLPGWSSKHGGLVVGGAVNHFSYLTARRLPPFHDYRIRLVYSGIETVNHVSDIAHRAVKACIEHLGVRSDGLEIMHASDLPGRSGTGSSSTFVVGLLKALSGLQGRLMLPHELAAAAIEVEQTRMGETVGAQDQVFAAHGGLNALRFQQNGDIDVRPLVLSADHVNELESNLLLFFTNVPRTSSEISATYAPTIGEKEREMFALMKLTGLAVDAIYQKKWDRLGDLIDQSWRIKSGLSAAVSTPAIAETYAAARLAGAWGGKLTGAGGGGCLLLVAPQESHSDIVGKMTARNCVHIPFRFSFSGSEVIFCDPNGIKEFRA